VGNLILKRCLKCGESKPREHFSRASKLPDGLQKYCKSCNAAYRAANKQRISDWGKEYHAKNRGAHIEKSRRYYAENRDRLLSYSKAYTEKNQERIKEYREHTKDARKERARKWMEQNKDYIAARAREYCIKHREKRNAYKVEWRRANPGKTNAYTSARRARLLQATPAWADEKAIAQYYIIARYLTYALGIPFQVDHTVPLQSEIVCGLHVPHNMNIMLGALNIGKSNRYWPDMP
jgi:hypothetical protein